MTKRAKIAAAGASTLALAASGVGAAVATGGDDSEPPIRGAALDKAGDAAMQHVGAGKVTDTEVGDEESYYEVEVRRPDGSQVDVQLDRGFNVVGQEGDSEKEPEVGGNDD